MASRTFSGKWDKSDAAEEASGLATGSVCGSGKTLVAE
jgi:hypothetical protein